MLKTWFCFEVLQGNHPKSGISFMLSIPGAEVWLTLVWVSNVEPCSRGSVFGGFGAFDMTYNTRTLQIRVLSQETTN